MPFRELKEDQVVSLCAERETQILYREWVLVYRSQIPNVALLVLEGGLLYGEEKTLKEGSPLLVCAELVLKKLSVPRTLSVLPFSKVIIFDRCELESFDQEGLIGTKEKV